MWMGNFFVHILDSREQALLAIPLFTDIVEHAGGTGHLSGCDSCYCSAFGEHILPFWTHIYVR
jgi:hypothetical protein